MSYFEIFEISSDGESDDADEFANNSLVKYDKEGEPYTYDDITEKKYEKFKTTGEIKVIGINCFISINNPHFNDIMTLPWTNKKKTPANGLPYLPFDENYYDLFFKNSDSNILIHSVQVNWSFENPKSKVQTFVQSFDKYLPPSIGNKSKTKKN